jgi:outer membrane receptor protein involved in Fe transport
VSSDLTQDHLQLLPKAALNYHLATGKDVYFSFSKGYRAGGYNIQMISDVVSNELRADLTNQIRTNLEATMRAAMGHAGVPQAAIDQAVQTATGGIPVFERMDIGEVVPYKPEYCWNYEWGTHLNFWEGRLTADASVFYTDIHDQQIARFADSGLGRMMVNAGRSRSCGGEASLRAQLSTRWTLTTSYGYTHATFTDYQASVNVNYTDNFVPFTPRHTVNAGLRYEIPCAAWSAFDKAHIGVNYQGLGRTYWTEANDASQSYYSLLDLNVGLTVGSCELTLWAKNLSDSQYATFCFNNSGSADQFFAQRGRPFRIGADLRISLR